MIYVQLAIAPVIVILAYIYYRDKYNKEPFWLLFFLFLSGAFSVIPVLTVGYFSDYFLRYLGGLYEVAYTAFVQAAFIEEFWKLFFTFVIAWWAKAFDERFDGIVYAVFVSMGFAAVENIMYVTGYGFTTGLLRMITAVPAHAIFGIAMGYYIGRAKFDVKYRGIYLILAFIVPWLLHGIYDFLIMAGVPWMTWTYIGFLILMYVYGFVRLKNLAKYKVKPEQQPVSNQNTQMNNAYNTNVTNNESGLQMNENPENNQEGPQPQPEPVQTSNDNSNERGFQNTGNHNQYVPPPAGVQQNQQVPPPPVKNHLDTLATLHYVWGGLKFLAALFILIYVLVGLGLILGGTSDGDMEMQFAGGMLLIFGLIGFVLVAAVGVLNILCGRYLQQKKNRVFCIVMSGLACMNAPLGTLLGIFTIIEVEKPEIKKMFES
ncbi:MAG: hypothetical protein C0596_05885 [Marinilabiliales bacterium]|nr:MAG: hypothetical protein C0596_05885 [Marinilabiliales bacterium]